MGGVRPLEGCAGFAEGWGIPRDVKMCFEIISKVLLSSVLGASSVGSLIWVFGFGWIGWFSIHRC